MTPRALVLLLAVAACTHGVPPANPGSGPAPSQLARAEPNDNRTAAGELRDGVLTLHLDAVVAAWRPDLAVDTAVTVQAFAQRGGPPQIPGPFVRVPAGTEIRLTVRNLIPDSTLFFQARTAAVDTLGVIRVPPGETREVSFRAADPGTYRYRGRTNLLPGVGSLSGRDAQLTGALVVDAPGVVVDPGERIFVLTLIDILPDSVKGTEEDIWEVAINGLSWPHTERLHYQVGDTARWRWLNATDRIHPMHLHGFHFRVLAKGDGRVDTVYTAERTHLAVTEAMVAGTTFAMEWVPTRAGNWLMHCHMLGHITPFPNRTDSVRAHDAHDLTRHAEEGMAGLVLAITTTGERVDDPALARGGNHHRLFVQESRRDTSQVVRRGYVLQRGAEPARDSVEIPGSPLVATLGQTTTVTVINRLTQPTSVHWHGMELESVFDGVPGFSGIGSSRAPLIAPGDSFTVAFTPPRAGTYMYHTHMDEEEQLSAGMYAPLIVLAPEQSLNPETDITLLVGHLLQKKGEPVVALNGQREPGAISVRPGVPHRLRLINLLANSPVRAALVSGDSVLAWRLISKDGADTPAALRELQRAQIARVGVGEAYDFEWIPAQNENPVLVLERLEGGGTVNAAISQEFTIRR